MYYKMYSAYEKDVAYLFGIKKIKQIIYTCIPFSTHMFKWDMSSQKCNTCVRAYELILI